MSRRIWRACAYFAGPSVGALQLHAQPNEVDQRPPARRVFQGRGQRLGIDRLSIDQRGEHDMPFVNRHRFWIP